MVGDVPQPLRVIRGMGSRWLLACILALTLGLHLWGIQRDLPYITEDPAFVKAAARVATSGDLNPRWFGHPGSTVIYPLAVVYHGWYALVHGGSWLRSDPGLETTYRASPAEFHLLGRLLTVVYALLSVLIVYQIGRETFGEDAATIGVLLAALYPTAVFDKMVRTDSASVFFAWLGLWRCLRLYDRPSAANQLLAGAAVGCAIGTKYYLGMLVAVLIIVDALVMWRDVHRRKAALLGVVVGLVAVALAFALTTPYFFLDYATAAKDLHTELRSSQLGADGLSATQNFFWYLTTALPSTISLPQIIAAGVGIGLSIWTRQPRQVLLAAFAVIFLIGISTSSLHWTRWLIPALPAFALFAAHGLEAAVAQLSVRLHLPRLLQRSVLWFAALLLAAPSASRVIQIDRLHANPSTNVLARQWIESNLPQGSQLAFEWQTVPPPLTADRLALGKWVDRDHGCNFIELSVSTLAAKKTLSSFRRDGYRYLITSSTYYAYYPANAERYPAEAAFYQTLLTNGRLLYQLTPSATHEGDEIRIYEVGG